MGQGPLFMFSRLDAGLKADLIYSFYRARALRCLRLLFAGLLAVVAVLAPGAAFGFDHGHKLFSAELRKYIRSDGVLYSRWKNKQEGLNNYLKALSLLSEEEYREFDLRQKEALWVNAYNALAIKMILDHYPVRGTNPDYPPDSIRQIPGCWRAISQKIAGRDVSLYTIAHDILRRDRDCRTHFAMVPASKGGGALQKHAFEPRTINAELDKLTRDYLSRPKNLSFDPEKNILTVSQIFRWFPLDFYSCSGEGQIPMPPPSDDQVVREYVSQFLPSWARKSLKGGETQVIYAPYDWSLNESGNSRSGVRRP